MLEGGIVNEGAAGHGMRCNKCGTQSPDTVRFCPVCGHKLQSDRESRENAPDPGDGTDTPNPVSRLLDFQGWADPRRGRGRYLEACAYAAVLAGGVAWYLATGILWPLYPLVAVCGLAAWLRRL